MILPSAPVKAPVRSKKRRVQVLSLLIVVSSLCLWKVTFTHSDVEAAPVPTDAARSEYMQAADTEESLLKGPEVIEQKPEQSVQDDVAQQENLEMARKFKQELAQQGDADEADYGFYDSLQASAWSVPVQRGVYMTAEDRKRASYRYMLQAASLRDRSEAASLVARLRKLGMNATYTVTGSGSAAWYRVNVGPFDNVSVMNKAEDRLVAMRMMPLKRRIE